MLGRIVSDGFRVMNLQAPDTVLRDGDGWIRFVHPVEDLYAWKKKDVMPVLQRVEEAVNSLGHYAAGFISYEAAPGFDESFPAKSAGDFPFIWFGTFKDVEVIDSLPVPDKYLPEIEWKSSISKDDYFKKIAIIRNYIRNGDTYQVNFSYRLRANTDMDPWRFFLRLVYRQEASFAGFIDTGEWTICSASPELFFRLDGNRIESRPMKGTAARGLWFSDDRRMADHLLTSQKERAENLMITDMVRNDLGRIAEPGSVSVPHLFSVERYPTVWQMTSTVQAMTNSQVSEIMKACFPPASITGAPKCRTMEIIHELEPDPRHIYTGTMGYMAPGRRAQFNVAIRTVLFNRNQQKAEYGVGGGIVWDSDPEKEFRECEVKAKILKDEMQEFSLLESMLWTPDNGYELLRYHLKRLAESVEYFGFDIDISEVEKHLEKLSENLPPAPHKVRLVVDRNGDIKCDAALIEPGAGDFEDIPLAADSIDSKNVFLYHKTTNRSVYDDAKKSIPGAKDVLLYNEKGEITESTRANVAFMIDGELCTPPVKCGLLQGTYRAWMLDQERLTERVITVEKSLQIGEAYLMNSVRGMKKIRILA